jgi:GntR family transcriptional regulator, carbon starvation induced regulator
MASLHLLSDDDSQVDNLSDPTRPRTLIEESYQRLRRDIIEGRYQPGEKLRVEHLKSAYQVSAGTLREALALLVSDALVVAQGQKGFRVAPMSLADLEDLTRTRVLLECEALRQSIARGDDRWEGALVAAFHTLTLAERRLAQDAVGDAQVAATLFDEWERCNGEFHNALIEASSSTWIKRLRSVLYLQTERYRRLAAVQKLASEKGPSLQVHEEHLEIFNAAIARDTERAAAALAHHINRALAVIKADHLIGTR